MKKQSKDLKSRKAAIKSLKSEMRKDMLEGLPEGIKGKMAVKVVSDSPEGLKEGLEKAEETMETFGDMSPKDLVEKAMKSKKSKKED